MSVPSPSIPPDEAAESLRHHTPFKLFWCASVASTIALQMQIVAVGWQVYQLTHSAFDLGIVGLVQFIPSLILVFVVGHVADRFDRRNGLCTIDTVVERFDVGFVAQVPTQALPRHQFVIHDERTDLHLAKVHCLSLREGEGKFD